MCRLLPQIVLVALLAAVAPMFMGCGTTRSSDTNRTATEQMLISNAIDLAVQSVDLKTLAGQSVFLDDSRLGEVVDRNYLISTLRQHLLASGCRLRDQRDQADYIVEARAGAIGTDRNDLLFGVPSTNVPQIFPVQPVPGAVIPEIPIAKRRDQKGIAKIGVFAYHRETGTPVWQSGLVHQQSSSNDVWILGAGPFQRGSIYDGTAFAGKEIGSDAEKREAMPRRLPAIGLAKENTFTTPKQLAKSLEPAAPAAVPIAAAAAQPVVQAVQVEPQPPKAVATPPATTQPTATPASVAPEPSEPKPLAVADDPKPAKPPAPQSADAPAGTTPLPQPRFDSR